MAEVVGYLKEDATSGERRVLKLLSNSLPPDFYVYVECPLHDEKMERMPDFIVLTTFGVVVLEVKDWVEILRADKFYVKIRSRSGAVYRKKSPVGQAREFAHILATEMQSVPELLGERRRLKVPWGYAAVFPNLGPAVITQLRRPLGKRYVLGIGDLKSRVVTKRLKATLPRDYNMRRQDLRYVRSVINPVTLITREGKHPIVIDQVQERIVTEAPQVQPAPSAESRPPEAAGQQATLLPGAAPETETKQPAPLPEEPPALVDVMRNCSIRLVRGVAGSGKTLVLTQRARYLSAQHPSWDILVLTYNKSLAVILRASLKGISKIKVTHFDRLCSALLKQSREWHSPSDPDGWLKGHVEQWPIVAELSPAFVSAEIKWIKEVGIRSRRAYSEAERKGRGKGLRRSARQQVYDVLEAYDKWLAEQSTCDWADVSYLVAKDIDSGAITPPVYDAVLIDEAQDFAPSWFNTIRRLLKPDSGLIFLADDPSQSIYRYYSWQEKGIPVVGRTRWLRIPYRNTREIYQAAYEVVREDELLRQQLEERTGITLEPDLNSEYLRGGPRPEMREFGTADEEFAFIRSEVEWLFQKGFDAREIAVLHRHRSGVRKLRRALRGTGVEVNTMHALKGLEFEAVFLSQLQRTFPEGIDRSRQSLSEERRLVYMSMTRARERLYLNYERQWPAAMDSVCKYVDRALT
jgi:hypothetical protein